MRAAFGEVARDFREHLRCHDFGSALRSPASYAACSLRNCCLACSTKPAASKPGGNRVAVGAGQAAASRASNRGRGRPAWSVPAARRSIARPGIRKRPCRRSPREQHPHEQEATARSRARCSRMPANAFRQAEMRKQRGQPEAGGEPGDRSQPARRAAPRQALRPAASPAGPAVACNGADGRGRGAGAGGVIWRCAPMLRPPPSRLASAMSLTAKSARPTATSAIARCHQLVACTILLCSDANCARLSRA